MKALVAYEGRPEAFLATQDDLRRDGFERKRPLFQAIMAEMDEVPVGTAVYMLDYNTMAGRPVIFVEDLFIAEEWRGMGAGQRLMAEVARIGLAEGCTSLHLGVVPGNPALGFYVSLGLSINPTTAMYLELDGLRALAESV